MHYHLIKKLSVPAILGICSLAQASDTSDIFPFENCPQELRELILKLVPPETMATKRLVCKDWNERFFTEVAKEFVWRPTAKFVHSVDEKALDGPALKKHTRFFSQIHHLNLSNFLGLRKLTSTKRKNMLFRIVSFCPNLETLLLIGNKLKPDDLTPLLSNQSLRKLYLGRNDKLMRKDGAILEFPPNLTELDLEGGGLPSCSTVVFRFSKNLMRLNLRKTVIWDHDQIFASITSPLMKRQPVWPPQLKELQLSACDPFLIKYLRLPASLTSLFLNGFIFGPKGIKALQEIWFEESPLEEVKSRLEKGEISENEALFLQEFLKK